MGDLHCYKSKDNLNRRVFIATPSYTGGTSPSYQASLLKTIEAARETGISVEWWMLAHDCHVDDARNVMIRKFIESKCDDFFFIDADVSWEAKDFVKQVICDKEIVGGIYPKRADGNQQWPVRFPHGRELWTDKDGWLEVEGLPAGFLRMKRSAIEKLYDREPKKYHARSDTSARKEIAIIFERTFRKPGLRFGGDFSMCEKWKALGGKLYTDPEMRLGHSGIKEWDGKLGYYLRKMYNLQKPYIIDRIRRIEVGDYDEGIMIDLFEAWENEWALSPLGLCTLAILLEEQTGRIFELGSGMTTFIMGAIAKRRGLEMVSVEHDYHYYLETKGFLDELGYNVELIYAPIKDNWYDYRPDRTFDFVLCDGPPRKYGRQDIMTIQDFFNPGAKFLMDDWDSISEQIHLNNVEFNDFDSFGIGVKK